MAFAKGTKTPIATTEEQIKGMLRKAKADQIALMEERDRAVVAFRLNGRAIRFNLPLPPRDNFLRSQRGTGWQENSESTVDNLWMQASRERWRQLHLCIKAKLESVEQMIELFDDAFLAQIVMPDGATVGEHARPMIAKSYETGTIQPLLPPPGGN